MPTPRSLSGKTATLLACLAILLTAVAKLLLLHSRELWLDETYSAFIARLPFTQLLRYAVGDVHPPLYEILLWLWVRLVGDSQARLRLSSVLLDIATMAAMLVLARRILGPRAGALAATLFAVSPIFWVYSLEVRNYMLLILIFVCLLLAHWQLAVERRPSWRLVFVYGILCALLFYVHYIALFVLLGLFAHAPLVSGFSKPQLIRIGAAAALTLALTAPWLPIMLAQYARKAHLGAALSESHSNPAALSYQPTLAHFTLSHAERPGPREAAVAAGFYPAASHLVLALCALPILLALAAILWLGLFRADPLCRLLFLLTLAVFTGMLALHLSATRYMLPLVPLLALCFARAVQYFSATRWHLPATVLGAALVCVYAAGFLRQATRPHARPWQDLASTVQQNYRPGDLIVFDALYTQVPFDYFARHQHFSPHETGFPVSIYDWWNSQPYKGWGGPILLQSDLDRFASTLQGSHPQTVFLVLYETAYYDPHDALLAKLSSLGPTTEIPLPPNADAGTSQQDSPIRLYRITLN